MNDTGVAFVIHLQSIFHIKNNTILHGRLVKGKRLFFPSKARIIVDGEEYRRVVLRSQVLPTPNILPRDVVSVACNEVVELSTQFVTDHHCELVVEEEQPHHH